MMHFYSSQMIHAFIMSSYLVLTWHIMALICHWTTKSGTHISDHEHIDYIGWTMLIQKQQEVTWDVLCDGCVLCVV